MSNGASKNLLAAIAELRSASAQMKKANASSASPTKTSKNRRKRAARRAAKAASGSSNGSGSMSYATAPAAVGSKFGRQAPNVTMLQGPRGTQVMVIRHREYVAEVPGSTAWTVTSYVVQPALQALFVWLAAMAGNFEKYRFRSLRFLYENESSTAQAGSVVYAFDFDALDSAPASKQAALSYKDRMRIAPWLPGAMAVDLRDQQRDFYYTRSGAVPSGADQKTYDVGKLHVGTQNCSGSTGELHVEYEIELHNPQPNVNPLSSKSSATLALDADSLVGTASFATGSNAGWVITDADTFTCTVAGGYLFAASLVGTTMVSTSLNVGSRGTAVLTAEGIRVDAAGTGAMGFAALNAEVGQTFKPAITSAVSVTSAVWRIATYNATALL